MEEEIGQIGSSTSYQEKQPVSSFHKRKALRKIVTNEEEEEDEDNITEQPTTSAQTQKQVLSTPDYITLDEDEAIDGDYEKEVISIAQPSTSKSTSGRGSALTGTSRPDDLDEDDVSQKFKNNDNEKP